MVRVKTDGDSFASIENERALVEFSKNGDSPNCPRSWTWGLWFDGNQMDATCDEMSLAHSVRDATDVINEIIEELSGLREFLVAYGAFGTEPQNPEHRASGSAITR